MNVSLELAQNSVQRVVKEQPRGVLTPDDYARVKELQPRCHDGDPAAREEMHQLITRILAGSAIEVPGLTLDAAVQAIYANLFGLGPVEEIWAAPDVDELQVTPYYVVRVIRGRIELLDMDPPDARTLRTIIDRTLFDHGAIQEGNPHVETTRADGSRITATVEPRSTFPILILRRHSAWAVQPENLMAAGMFDQQGLALMEMLVRSRHNIVISGPCGSGKTTLLRVMAGFFDPALQIVSIEQGHPELLLSNFYKRRIYKELVAKDSSELDAVFESALRESPDVVLAAEARGSKEVANADRAASRGHAGTMLTFHALTPEETVESMAVLLMESGRTLPLDLLKLWLAKRFQIIINVWGDSIRGYKRVVGITEVHVVGTEIYYRPLCRWVPTSDDYSKGFWEYFAPSARALDLLLRQGDPQAVLWWREVSGTWKWPNSPAGGSSAAV